MGQLRITSSAWSGHPADDAAHFYSTLLPMARKCLAGEKPSSDFGLEGELDAIAFIFPFGGKEHEGWQRAAIQTLAREAAPKRVNGVIGDDRNGIDAMHAIDAVTDWLEQAPGITGQLLAVD
jgi:hypothetical protein